MSSSKQHKNISLTSLKKTLSQAAFNPRKPGPMKIVASMDNPEYWMRRSTECTMAALEPGVDNETLLALLTQSLQLLALAKTKLANAEPVF
jgi:hypothetical protein